MGRLWAEFLSANYQQYYFFPRKNSTCVPCSRSESVPKRPQERCCDSAHLPAYFDQINPEGIRDLWDRCLRLREQEEIPKEIALEVILPPGKDVAEHLREEINNFGPVFRGVPFLGVSLSALDSSAHDIQGLMRFFRDRFYFKSGAFFSLKVSGDVTALNRDILRQVSSISLAPHSLESRNLRDLLNSIKEFPEIMFCLELQYGGLNIPTSFADKLGNALKARPKIVCLSAAENFQSSGDHGQDWMDSYLKNFGYALQKDDQIDYLDFWPWEKKTWRSKHKLCFSSLGFGAEAMSHAFGVGWYVGQFLTGAQSGFCYHGFTDWDMDDEMRSYVLGSLEQTNKISRKNFKNLFKRDALDVEFFRPLFDRLIKLGLVSVNDDFVLWTSRDRVKKAVCLKWFLSSQIVKKLLKTDIQAFRDFSRDFDSNNLEIREKISLRQLDFKTHIYYDQKFWNC